MDEIKCKHCEKLFEKTHALKVYCSQKCCDTHWCKNNKERIHKYYIKSISTPETKQKRVEYSRRYYMENKEKHKERMMKWANRNRERILTYNRKYYVHRKTTKEYKEKIKERDPAYAALATYLRYRKNIFNRFGKTDRGLNRFYQQESWKQRLAEMDNIFIEETIRVFIMNKIDLEKLITHYRKKIAEQTEEFEAKLKGDNFPLNTNGLWGTK